MGTQPAQCGLRLACRADPRAEARGRRGAGGAVLGRLLEWAAGEGERSGLRKRKRGRPRATRAKSMKGRERERVFSFSFISNVFQIHFQLHLNHFEFWSIPLTSINQMHQHICTTMLLHPIMNFNLIKNIIFPMFHEHKNS